MLCWLGSQLGIYRKLRLSPLGTVHETVLGHLLIFLGGVLRTIRSTLQTHFSRPPRPTSSTRNKRSVAKRGWRMNPIVVGWGGGAFQNVFGELFYTCNFEQFLPLRSTVWQLCPMPIRETDYQKIESLYPKDKGHF